MLNIIKSDLYRIFRGKAIYVILIIISLLTVVNVVGLSAGHVGINTGSNISLEDTELLQELSNAKSLTEYRSILKSQGAFALDMDIVGKNINLYYIFIVIVVTVLTVDFSNKSIKNTLSSAINRKKYYLSKLFLTLGLCTFIVLFNNYFSYFLNLIVNGHQFSSSFIDITRLTIIQMPLIYGIISLLVCLAFVFKKTSMFNTVSIPFIMAIQLLVMGITNLFKIKADWFYNYEVQFALNNLANNPANNYVLKCILLGFAYIIIFNLIGYYSFKNTEIK